MKITVVGDVHWSETSSIVTNRTNKCGEDNGYTDRLNRLIQTINWCEFTSFGSDKVVYLGDFFDKVTLTDMEVTALKEINWNKSAEHLLVLGNHEWGKNGCRNNSANALIPYGFKIISNTGMVTDGDTDICFYPYTQEEYRKPLTEIFGPKLRSRIVFSHNDIKGIQYGAIVSTSGVDINDIENNCDLFLNGHLHNGSPFSSKGINVGNICGQNFTEDAFRYNHSLLILDTDNKSMEWVENPNAYNFYKIEINNEKDLEKLYTLKLSKHNVVSVKCNESLLDECRLIIKEESGNISYSRVIVVRDNSKGILNENLDTAIDLNINHLNEFADFIHNVVGTSDMVEEELGEVLK